MRTFKPLIKIKEDWVAYPNLTIDKAIVFGERNKEHEIIFETEANNIREYLDVEQLKEML